MSEVANSADRSPNARQGITFGDRFLEIGLWRFADVALQHCGNTWQVFMCVRAAVQHAGT